MKKIGLLVFDLDGTLIDSLGDIAGSLNYTLEKMGFPIKSISEVRHAIGDGVKMLLTRCMPRDQVDRFDEAYDIFHEHYKIHCHDTTYFYEGVVELLFEYREMSKAVLTNKNHQPTLDILEHLGILDRFDAIVGGDTFPTRKPDPEGLVYIMKSLNCAPEETVMIGDGIPDIAVTKGTRVTSIAILHGITEKRRLLAQKPDFTIDSFNELSSLLKTL